MATRGLNACTHREATPPLAAAAAVPCSQRVHGDWCGCPRVSVVVPTYRRLRLLQRCLKALEAQSIGQEAFEVLVVDDGHCERTRHWVLAEAKRHPPGWLRYLRPEAGRGPAVARNHGWRQARAQLIAFTDDDTVPDEHWLLEGERAMAGGDHAGVAGRVVVPRPEGAGPAPCDHERMTRGLETASFVTANAFVSLWALSVVQGFDERFARAWREDSDLQFRLEALAGPLGRAERAVVQHPVRPERWGVSLRQQKNVFYDALLYAKHPARYRRELRPRPPWDYYAIVALALAALLFAALGQAAVATGCALGMLGLQLALALRRLRGASHAGGHVAEMLATSLLIPFLSVFWRLRGARRFRVWFW
ncbi:MAG: glycosyltransferase [Hydrogenophaga sp.]|uniref:glycosyltransferase family 2 protein n=1 Tax=Hydrogenophaga sp. TaxID=1904254 RepID=UPI0016A02549|nr:glycosyltransferase family 2 protein [Hydrogenophaga sp.]NIM41126.1 glycosyltransferase [Hydrogenophaga sp.]NIN26442.1 glycosyltransferase [Hydrogenophaga sp.]NIN31317.1 glycosyltransferase [Hydrogenophaga sp.]NIN55372.1 glycosyltransferase [Hydrogenophaga sp.]NIO51707.1 glycosyltransferase [Hydrogenophaga sp.]